MIGGAMSSSSSSSSSTKIILENFSRGSFRCGTEIFSLVPGKSFVQSLRFDSAPTRTWLLKASQVDLSAAEIQTPENKVVHVRFQLQKECAFGEHFFILGDDPALGLWDPQHAIPLNWSDGHVWTVELDLPVGLSVEFKFILKEKTGKLSWQPGQNRVFETWETNNSIIVCEDWENVHLQRRFEEEPMHLVSSTDSNEEIELSNNNPSVVEMVGSSLRENSATIVAENIGNNQNDSEANMSSDESLTSLDENGTEVAIVTEEEEGPVLVPGLTPPVSVFENEDRADVADEEETSITDATVEVLVEDEMENSAEIIQQGFCPKEEEEKKREGEEGYVFEKDIEWGRLTLHKLLNTLGLV